MSSMRPPCPMGPMTRHLNPRSAGSVDSLMGGVGGAACGPWADSEDAETTASARDTMRNENMENLRGNAWGESIVARVLGPVEGRAQSARRKAQRESRELRLLRLSLCAL